MQIIGIFKYASLLGILLLLAACRPETQNNQPVIGFLMETLKEERWQKDRDYFVAAAEKLGAKVIVLSCNGSDETQISQAENLITRGADVLVVVPHNTGIAATIVNNAKANQVKVIAYDRLIMNCEPDLYVSFDNEKVGELQAQYLSEHAPEGNYVLIGGSPVDNNARLVRKGQMKVLDPFIKSGKIKIVADQWAMNWQPIEALKHVENALTRQGNQVDAIVTSNDGTAGGAIQALIEQNLAGQVLVSGQDADLEACRRILNGTQSMTVYKPIRPLAEAAAEAAVQLVSNQPVTKASRTVYNGKTHVPSILLTPVMVDKSNLIETVVRDAFHSKTELLAKP